MDYLLTLLESLFLPTANSAFGIQALLLGVIATVLIFLIFYTTKDIVARTNSFPYMLFSLLVVTLFPVVGFLFYLLIRPVHTKQERALFATVESLRAEIASLKQQKVEPKKQSTKKFKSTKSA